MTTSTRSVGRESCGASVVRAGALHPCLTVTHSPARPPWWETDQAGAAAKADEWGAELAALLCVGCNRRLARLIEEGRWNP